VWPVAPPPDAREARSRSAIRSPARRRAIIALAVPPPLFDLICRGCGAPYPPAGLPATCACGGFWVYRHGALGWRPPAPATGLQRWAGIYGLGARELPDRELGEPPARYGGVQVTRQGSAPAGSFKERGAEVLVAACVRRGVERVFLDSSGNAGLAVARACSARGIACQVLVPAATPDAKRRAIADWGAEVVAIAGDREATHLAARRLAADLPYASHILQPFFLAGVASLAWDLDWPEREPPRDRDPEAGGGSARRHWLLPAGNGSLLLGVALGLEVLGRAGRLACSPALHAVQLCGFASLAPEGSGEPPAAAPRAAGIAIADPPRRAEMLAALRHSGGDVTPVSDAAVAEAAAELAAAGLKTDPTGGAAWAGWRARRDLPAADTLVVLTSREA